MPEHQHIKQSRRSDTSSQRQIIPARQTHVSNPATIIQRARIDPKSLTSADVLQLQRTIGNRAVGRLLSEIRSPSTARQAPVQRQEIQEEKEPLQGVFEKKPEQSTCTGCSTASIQRKKKNLTGMPDNLKSGVESLSGIDMGDIRVHYNSSKPADIGALAYTQGTDIHVAPGQERHLPHEAWHVVQQAKGRVKPTMQLKDGVSVNDDEGLEHEADAIGEKAFTTGQNLFFRQGGYQSGSRGCQKLIAHELTHVVQQKSEGVAQRQVDGWEPAQVDADTVVYHCTDYASAKSIIDNGIQAVTNTWGGGALGPGFYTHKTIQGAVNYVADDRRKVVLKFVVLGNPTGQKVTPSDFARKKEAPGAGNPVDGNAFLSNAEDTDEIKWHGGGALKFSGFALGPEFNTFYLNEQEMEDNLSVSLSQMVGRH